MEAGARSGEVELIACASVCRYHSTGPRRSAAGGISVRSRPPCPSCPSLTAPPAACHGRASPWRTVRPSARHRQHFASRATPFGARVKLLFGSSVFAGYQLRASIYSYGPADSQPSPFTLDASIRSAEALSGKRPHVTSQ